MDFRLFLFAGLAGLGGAAGAWGQGQGMTEIAANHMALHVTDPEQSASFYGEVLGLERMPPRSSPTVVWLRAGGFELHLIGGRGVPVQSPAEVHLAFRVPDLEPVMAKLDARSIAWGGFKAETGTVDTRADGVLQIFFRDPDGYWIEVNQLPR